MFQCDPNRNRGLLNREGRKGRDAGRIRMPRTKRDGATNGLLTTDNSHATDKNSIPSEIFVLRDVSAVPVGAAVRRLRDRGENPPPEDSSPRPLQIRSPARGDLLSREGKAVACQSRSIEPLFPLRDRQFVDLVGKIQTRISSKSRGRPVAHRPARLTDD